MKVVIVGATGNVGTSLIRALADEDRVDSIIGIARRTPSATFPKTDWVAADIVRANLQRYFLNADAVVHLGWVIQPSHRPDLLRKVNIVGSDRVFQAAAACGVKNLIYASSVGAYSPGPKSGFVDESWPVDGVLTSFYSRHKSQVEKMLDRFEAANPQMRVVRLRKALIFKGEAASHARRIFMGPFFPNFAADPKFIRIMPHIEGLRIQAVHTMDAAMAYRLALTSDVRGAFNIAAEPVLDTARLAKLFGATTIPVASGLVRAATFASWKLRLQPTPPGWLDMGMTAPLMDCSKAESELGWKPSFTAEQAVLELLEGISHKQGGPTPPLATDAGGPARIKEIATGVGQLSGVGKAPGAGVPGPGQPSGAP